MVGGKIQKIENKGNSYQLRSGNNVYLSLFFADKGLVTCLTYHLTKFTKFI